VLAIWIRLTRASLPRRRIFCWRTIRATVEHLNGRRCDLMLSGHTHGGQVHVPGLGRPTLSKKARQFAAGLYHYRNTYVYVNKGVGFGFRFRYGVRPEVTVLVLRPGPDA